MSRFTVWFPATMMGFFLSCMVPAMAGDDWPNASTGQVLPYETTGMHLGPLLGDVQSRSIKVWVRTAEPTDFEIVFSRHLPLDESSEIQVGTTDAKRDMTGSVVLRDLEPETRYYYGVRINGMMADLRRDIRDDWPSFRTLPDASSYRDPRHNPEGKFNVCFGIGHCASQAPIESGGQYASPPAYDSMHRNHRERMQFAIVNGDVIYEAERNGSLSGVRDNYKLYYRRGRSFMHLFRNTPAMFTYDDHDVGWDLHGAGQVGLGAGRHLMRDVGLQGYEEYLSWANPDGPHRGQIRTGTAMLDRTNHAIVDPDADFRSLDLQQVSNVHLGAYTRGSKGYHPSTKPPSAAGVYSIAEVVDAHTLRLTPRLRQDRSGVPEQTLRYSIGTHHYYDWRVANCHFFALDTRGERSQPNTKRRDDPSRYVLGDAQKKWLLDGVRHTDAEFVMIVSPDPWVIFHTAAHVRDDPESIRDDKGDGYPSFQHERRELIDAFDALEQPVLIFTGDVHASASVQITDNVWEMMCGPLGSTGHPLATLGNPPSGGKWSSYDREVLIRWLTPFPNEVHYSRQRNAFYGIVQVNNGMRVASPDHGDGQFYAYDVPSVTVRWHDAYSGELVYAETVPASQISEETPPD